MTEGERAGFLESAVFDSLLVRSARESKEVELLGRDRVDGVLCYVLKIAEGEKEHVVYVEPVRFNEVWIRTTGDERIDDTRLSDYRKVDGIWLPFRIVRMSQRPGEVDFGAGVTTEILVDRAELNVGVFDSFFE